MTETDKMLATLNRTSADQRLYGNTAVNSTALHAYNWQFTRLFCNSRHMDNGTHFGCKSSPIRTKKIRFEADNWNSHRVHLHPKDLPLILRPKVLVHFLLFPVRTR